MHKRNWDQSKALLGKKHPITLTSMANLAAAYSNQGLSKEAEKLRSYK